MPKFIPKEIKTDVIAQLLSGISEEQIADNIGISTGTVSSILKGLRESDVPDIDMLRSISKFLNRENLSPYHLFSSIRLRKLLEKIQLPENILEKLLEDIGVYCFKNQTTTEEFLSKIIKIFDAEDIYECSLSELPKIIEQKCKEMEALNIEISNKKQKIIQLHDEFGITVKDLQEYRKMRPLANNIVELRKEIYEKDDNIRKLESELLLAKMDLGMEKYLRTHPEEVKEYEDLRKEENI